MNKWILNSLFLFFTLTVFTCCQGQVKQVNPIPEHSGIGQVVAELDKRIWVIFQDSRNHYWFGSNGNGVYCYNGKNLKQFTTRDGLYSNQIRGIQEDKAGQLYFETPNGINQFNGKAFIALRPALSPFSEWKLQPGDLWFKGNGAAPGVFRYDGNTLHELAFSSISSGNFNANHDVYSIYKDRKGNIWFGTITSGVGCFNGTALNWIYEDELGSLKDGRAPAIRSIVEDKDGYFWFSNLLYQYKIRLDDPLALKYERTRRIELSRQKAKMELPYYTSAIVDNENIWMTNYNEGIWKYDGKDLTPYRLKDGAVNVLTMYIYKDNAGSIWVGTDNAGVYKLNGGIFEKFNP